MAAEHPIKLGGYTERLGLKRKVCELGGEVIWGQRKGIGGSMKVAGSSSAASPQTQMGLAAMTGRVFVKLFRPEGFKSHRSQLGRT